VNEPRARAALGAGCRSARTRSAIIDAALTLFREKGYDATTMRAIASSAGVSVGNAY
jgi:AcrR family transcriptional regulator